MERLNRTGPAGIRAEAVAACALFCLLLVAAVALQWHAGAYASDFAGHPDEAAHAVSSLAILDYFRLGFPSNPVRFAERYYVHFPRLAIGHWPPLFHATEAAWMLVAGRGRTALLSPLAVWMACLGAAMFAWTRRHSGLTAAVVCVPLVLSTPFLAASLSIVTPDILLGFIVFCAAAVWGAYIQSRRRRDLLIFIALAIAAVATHPRGLVVGLVPLVSAWLLAEKGKFPWRPFLVSVLVSVVLLLPRLYRGAASIQAASIALDAGGYLALAWRAFGWPAIVLAAAGAAAIFLQRSADRRGLAFLALGVSAFLFHSMTGTTMEPRYLVTLVPALTICAAAGWRLLWRMPVAAGALVAVRFVLVAGAVFVAAANLSRVARKADTGYARLPAEDHLVSVVAGDPEHEGAYVAEAALRDRRMRRIVLRASKMLASSTWAGRQYRAKFADPAEIRSWLDDMGASLVVVQETSRVPHVGQLLRAVRESKDWRAAGSAGSEREVTVFARSGPTPPRRSRIQLDVSLPLFGPMILRE